MRVKVLAVALLLAFASQSRAQPAEHPKLTHVLVDGRTSEGSAQAFGGSYPASCLYTTGAFIAKNPATMQRLVNAFAQALTWIDRAGAAEIAAALPAVTPFWKAGTQGQQALDSRSRGNERSSNQPTPGSDSSGSRA